MPSYDFRQLSSQDFEELTRSLLQSEWKCRLESFKTGRDQGIDLRYARSGAGDLIVQCKHYVNSGFTALRAHLRKFERAKVGKLAPRRYVIVTSVGLTPANKADIFQLFRPYILRTEDVIGQDDLNNLLSIHPEVEKNSVKLWLASAAVLSRVIQTAEITQSAFEVARIRANLMYYVQNAGYARAVEILERGNVVACWN